MDMNTTEKVINDLNVARFMLCNPQMLNPEMCIRIGQAITSAIDLLNPRVLTLEELKQFEGSPCWFESSGIYMGKDGFWIIPAMFRTFSTGMIMSYTSILDGVGGCSELGLSAYNKTWRCWTAKPTIEQRKAVIFE